MSWVGFSIMTSLWASYLFTLVGFLQMADWAMKKHKVLLILLFLKILPLDLNSPEYDRIG